MICQKCTHLDEKACQNICDIGADLSMLASDGGVVDEQVDGKADDDADGAMA